jgi:homoserine dehydrogenase
VGNVGRALLGLLDDKASILASRYGLEFSVVGAADSSGAVMDPDGIFPRSLRLHKAAGRAIADFPHSAPEMSAPEMLSLVQSDLLVEASAVNLDTGQPGLDCCRIALRRGMAVVLANKAPLVHGFRELSDAASAGHVDLAYSATVCGALPVINIGRRDLGTAGLESVRGVFNSTSNFILGSMARGREFGEALAEAQAAGVAEADPALDLQGWDTANKLVIIANSVLRQPACLGDVTPVTGITDIDISQIREAKQAGKVIKLVASALRRGDHYHLQVQPEWLSEDDVLATVNDWDMGIAFETDIMGRQQYKVDERGPVPTAAAVLRDVVNLAANRAGGECSG